MKNDSKSGNESRMKNGFSAMHVILSRAKYKFMTSSDDVRVRKVWILVLLKQKILSV